MRSAFVGSDSTVSIVKIISLSPHVEKLKSRSQEVNKRFVPEQQRVVSVSNFPASLYLYSWILTIRHIQDLNLPCYFHNLWQCPKLHSYCFYTMVNSRWSPRGIMANMMNCNMVVNKLKCHLCFMFTFWLIPLGNIWTPLFPQLWVKQYLTILLHSFWHWITHKDCYPIKQRN